MRRRAWRAVLAVLLLAAAITVWLLSGDALRLTPPLAFRTAPLLQFVEREFSTTDSLTIAASQVVRTSRGTMVVLHGLGDHQAAESTFTGALRDRATFNVVGFSLRGFDRPSRTAPLKADRNASPTAVRDAFAYTRDVAAVIHEVRRREPSGPIILVGLDYGAGLAVRYLEATPPGSGNAPDGVLLVHPLMTLDDLRTASPARVTARLDARRLRLFSTLVDYGVSRAANATVTVTDSVPQQPRSTFSVGALRGITAINPWRALRARDVPMLVLASAPPDTTVFPQNDVHQVLREARTDSLSTRALEAIDVFLTPFAAAAANRVPVRPWTTVPVIKP